MKLTEKARAVLEAAAIKNYGIGARQVAGILGYGNKFMRAGQYMGRLKREGWVISKMQWYVGRRGRRVYSHTLYFITKKGREAMRASLSCK
jgi:hypothetical protein